MSDPLYIPGTIAAHPDDERDMPRGRGVIAALCIAFAAASTLGIIAAGAAIIAERQDASPVEGVRVELPACVTEDSADCYWDGGDNGGRAFVDVDGIAYYLPAEAR